MTEKKRLVVSFKNLPEELKEELNAQYPNGYGENLIKVNKSATEFFYAVPFETEDTKYLVKIDVKVDLNHEDEEEEDSYSDESMIPEAPEGMDEDDDDDFDDDFEDNIPDEVSEEEEEDD